MLTGRLAQLVERPLDVRKVHRFEPCTAHQNMEKQKTRDEVAGLPHHILETEPGAEERAQNYFMRKKKEHIDMVEKGTRMSEDPKIDILHQKLHGESPGEKGN